MSTRKCKTCRVSLASTNQVLADLSAAPALARERAEEHALEFPAPPGSPSRAASDPFRIGALEHAIESAVRRLSGYCSEGCDPASLEPEQDPPEEIAAQEQMAREQLADDALA